jgi:hypothetical protein
MVITDTGVWQITVTWDGKNHVWEKRTY